MTDFVHLHLHTEYSLLDGAVRISESVFLPDNPGEPKSVSPLADALKEFGMKACAITDHGNMYGVYTFVKKMRKAGIKPIIGEEFYVADDMYVHTPDVLKQRYHLVLLAKNLIGYKNLMKLSSMAFVDGFYMKPRIDLKHIAEHSEGLICLSACLAGKVPQLILQRNFPAALEYAREMRDIFAPGDFYIELQEHGLAEDKIVTNPLAQIAKEIGVKVVATNDVHYIKQEDADIQDTMMCVNLQCKKNEMNNARFDNDNFYLKSGDEMAEMFAWCPEAIATTLEIADKVEDYFVDETKIHYIPQYTNDEIGNRTNPQYLHDLAFEGVKKRYPEITDEIKQRLDYELGVINDCGYDDYFLIVWDYVHAAQEMGIPVGPGRGSGVGSLVSYSIGITDVDPLRFNLLFERFLSKERVSMPDFDVDFCFIRRQEVVDYCINKYGKENVSQIIAYSTMSAKAVVKDVARVFDVPYNEANAWVKDIPTGKVCLSEVMVREVKNTDKNEKNNKDWIANKNYSEDFVNTYLNNPTAKKVIDTAMKLEGMPRQTSMHAAGVVVCSDPVLEHVALSRNGQDITTQFDKNVVEDIGLLKMDFLGLKTLTDISEALKYIKKDKGITLDFHELGYEDKAVYELISSGDCEGVFQLESGGMKKFMAQLHPDSLEDVMAGISMFRPGPMQYLDKFLEGKRHPENVTYQHPLLKGILENTYGCIVYQEQVMQIAQKLAGYSFGCADILRKGVAKKKADKIKKQQDVFLNGGILSDDTTKTYIPGALKNGVGKEVVDRLFADILQFASYAFNKSHAAAYAFLTYQTAYLKCHYRTYYLTAVVNNRITSADETKHYMNYMRQVGIKMLPPDINRSEKYFGIEGDDVRYGLMGIKNVGETAMEYVLTERVNGAFKDVRDLIERCSGQINKRMIESLIKGGALDSFGKNRATLMASYERIMDTVASDKKGKLSGQMSLFDELIEDVGVKYNELEEYPKAVVLANEKEVLGMYVSGHPLDDYADARGEFNFDTSQLLIEESDEDGEAVMSVDMSLSGAQVRFGCVVSSFEKKMTKSQQKFAVGIFEDKMGTVAFTMFSKSYEKYGEFLNSDTPVKVFGRVDLRDESEPKISVDRIEPWVNAAKSGTSGKRGILYIKLENQPEQRLVSGILSLFEGTTPCQAQIKTDGKSRLMEFSQKVKVCDELIERLSRVVGNDGVKYVLK